LPAPGSAPSGPSKASWNATVIPTPQGQATPHGQPSPIESHIATMEKTMGLTAPQGASLEDRQTALENYFPKFQAQRHAQAAPRPDDVNGSFGGANVTLGVPAGYVRPPAAVNGGVNAMLSGRQQQSSQMDDPNLPKFINSALNDPNASPAQRDKAREMALQYSIHMGGPLMAGQNRMNQMIAEGIDPVLKDAKGNPILDDKGRTQASARQREFNLLSEANHGSYNPMRGMMGVQ
jgi:hypothetical protein